MTPTCGSLFKLLPCRPTEISSMPPNRVLVYSNRSGSWTCMIYGRFHAAMRTFNAQLFSVMYSHLRASLRSLRGCWSWLSISEVFSRFARTAQWNALSRFTFAQPSTLLLPHQNDSLFSINTTIDRYVPTPIRARTLQKSVWEASYPAIFDPSFSIFDLPL